MTRPARQFGQAYAEYQSNRNLLRKAVRKSYLRHAASFCQGPTLDFGCGIGELLSLLPPGSRGLEINPYAVQYCRDRGLSVEIYDPMQDQYRLESISPGEFQTLVLSHVLEHLEDPDQTLRTLFKTCMRIGIHHVLVIVPGAKGYGSDTTHKTFVTRDYLEHKGIFGISGVRMAALNYFPINIRALGNVFTHHEMKLVFELSPTQPGEQP